MQVIHDHCAGLDVHKKTVVACVWITPPDGRATRETRTFGTMTADVLALGDWLKSQGVTHVAMESTGVYWKPIYNLLEGNFVLLVVNAHHIKAVPGRKTDVADAEWIGDLLRHGLVRASFIPPRPQRELRELTRHRTNLVGKRAQAVNELQKVLESANVKLASVASDITGVSATAMLRAMLEGQSDVRELAELAKGRLRSKKEPLRQALAGTLRAHHKLIVAQLLADIDFLEEQVAEVSQEIERRTKDDQPTIDRLDDIPGINQRLGEIIVAEIGTDMSRFPSADHLVSWAGLCPGNQQSAGKRRSSRIRPGNLALKTALVEAAHGASRVTRSYLHALYHRLVPRRGKKRALIAVARTILESIYHMLARGTHWLDLGADYFERRNPLQLLTRLTHRIEKLGYQVALSPLQKAA
jgi:transposase